MKFLFMYFRKLEKRPFRNKIYLTINEFYRDFSSTANENNLKIRHYGSRKKLSKKLLSIIDEVTSITKDNKGTIVNLLFNYGSRQE